MAACRGEGVRVTPQRLEVFRELVRSQDHPTADRIYREVRTRLPTISLDTVYRTLSWLEEKRLATRVGVHAGSTRYEAEGDPHHHFVCTACGCIADIRSESLDGQSLARLAPEGCEVRTARLELRGRCSRCLRSATGRPGSGE